jgi:hypothetical protein
MVRRSQVRSIAVLRMEGTDWSQVAYPQLHEPGTLAYASQLALG